MRPSFNTSGPCVPGEHYMVPPERRLGRTLTLIDDGKYFTLTAGRQTGKTTSLMWLVRHLKRRTHIDSLISKRHDLRVRKILDPMLAGETTAGDVLDDDFAYVLDLGLVRQKNGLFEIANPIYREVKQLARYLDTLGQSEGWLVLFDLRSTKPWEERLSNREVLSGGKLIHVVGC